MDWFLCDRDLRHERVKMDEQFMFETLNPFQYSVVFNKETSYLICTANQVTVFYIKYNNRLKRVNNIYMFQKRSHCQKKVMEGFKTAARRFFGKCQEM